MTLTPGRVTWSLSLLVYCAALIVIAYFPRNEWHVSEILVVVFAGLAIIAILLQLIPGRRVPGAEFAYLMVGFAGTVTIITYIARSRQEDWVEAEVLMLLAVGVIASFGAYLTLDRRQG